MSTLPVVVAVDGSEGSLRALDWAVTEAQLREAPLRLVHVRQYPDWPQTELALPEPEEVVGDSADLILDDVLRTLRDRPGLPGTEARSLAGAPAEVLAGQGGSAQLVVLGSRGRGGFASLLLGSNGIAVARDAPCPVVVVPPAGRRGGGEAPPAAPGRRIVVGVSAAAPDDGTLGFAWAAAERHDARLHVVCAYSWPGYIWTGPGDFTPTPADQEAAQAATTDQLDEILRPYRARYPGVAADPQVLAGDAAGHLVAASTGATLVVVGRHHRRLSQPARMLGSVTHAVLLHTAAPVAVVPPVRPGEQQD
jgi:nucleotide-binding universal stress UspA family protein